MNIDDDGGLTQFLGQALVLPAELQVFLFLRVVFGLRTALVRGQSFENACLPLAPPRDQVGGIEGFAAQQGSDGAGVSSGGVGLGQDAKLVLGGKSPTLGGGNNFRIRQSRGAKVLALLSNYDQENCLINVGTEG